MKDFDGLYGDWTFIVGDFFTANKLEVDLQVAVARAEDDFKLFGRLESRRDQREGRYGRRLLDARHYHPRPRELLQAWGAQSGGRSGDQGRSEALLQSQVSYSRILYQKGILIGLDFIPRSDLTTVCKGMKFHRFPLDEHICYLKLTSCKWHVHIKPVDLGSNAFRKCSRKCHKLVWDFIFFRTTFCAKTISCILATLATFMPLSSH